MQVWYRIKYFIFVFLVSAIIIPGCDLSTSNDPFVEERGWFSVTITGDIEETISGEALYAYFDEPASGTEGAVLNFLTTRLRVTVTGKISRFNEATEYQIVEYNSAFVFPEGLSDNTFYGFYVNEDLQFSEHFLSHSGRIETVSITDDRLEGVLNFVASGISQTDPTDTVSVTVSGNFEAVKGSLEFN